MADEKRLIDANEFQFEPDPWGGANGCLILGRTGGKTMKTVLTMLKRMIENATTVDAVEVIHAHWEDEHGGKYANPRYRCSACKERALYKFERDLLDNWKEVQALTDYCPNCGARMDGDGNG